MNQVAEVKKLFFDRAAVTDRIDPAVKKALSKFGAFVRKRAKSSLKYKKGTAPSGSPPFVHRGGMAKVTKNKKTGIAKVQPVSPLRELLFFSYDPDRRSVVIGPAKGGPASGAPEKLEHGQHPFMAPAFEAELPNAPNEFQGLIR